MEAPALLGVVSPPVVRDLPERLGLAAKDVVPKRVEPVTVVPDDNHRVLLHERGALLLGELRDDAVDVGFERCDAREALAS
jgi:hypothetical protein